MKFKLMTGAALAAVFAATGAMAQVDSGPYVAADVGYHFPEGFEGQGGGREWTFSIEDDWAGFARLGYRLNPTWRVELEGGYRPGDIESVLGTGPQPIGLCTAGVRRTVASPTCGAPQGEFKAGTLMANVIYDFMPGSSFRPFIGAGIGFAELHNKVFGQLSHHPVGAVQFQNASFDDSERTWAWQGILGVAWEMTERLSLDLTGRYLGTGDVEFGSVTTNGGTGGPGTIVPVGFMEGNYRDTSITLGLRYAFGPAAAPPPMPEPEPAPMPEPEPAPAPTPMPEPAPVPEPPARMMQEFIVYFPWDEYYLTTEAQTVVQEAANYAAAGQTASVVVVGHADTSGSAAYNIRLSERRAKTVAEALVGLGVPQSTISADWRGETENAVATGDGVREPLNRRATITVNP